MKSILIISIIIVAIISCKGPQGEVGPQGTQGSQGIQGNAGPIGTANVIYSEWTNITFTGSGSSWQAKISAPKITQEILDKGLVKTYFKLDKNVYELPLASGGLSYLYQSISIGNINLLSNSKWSSEIPWRYVIIPGGIGARRANIDYSDYEAVKKAYNIPD
jgi:hypothetical protein